MIHRCFVRRTPHATFAVNEVYVYMWNCTPLIGGSMSELLMQSLLIANKVRGGLRRKETTSSSEVNAFFIPFVDLLGGRKTSRNSSEVKL
jgi:hypothetical protein